MKATKTNQIRRFIDDEKSPKCPVCHFVVRTRIDGTIGSHHLWSGKTYLGKCHGTGMMPSAS